MENGCFSEVELKDLRTQVRARSGAIMEARRRGGGAALRAATLEYGEQREGVVLC